MFQSIRDNSPIYIFYKKEKTVLEVGYANSASVTKPKYAMPATFGQPQEMVADISVKVNGEICNFTGLPATAEIADATYKNESVVISDSREAINSEINSLMNKSLDIIKSVPFHENFAKGCSEVLLTINPELAEKEAQKKEITELKSRIEDMAKGMQEMLTMNKQLMEQMSQKPKNYENVGN